MKSPGFGSPRGVMRLRPPMLLLGWFLSVVTASGQKPTETNLPTLTKIEQIREMTIEEAGRGYPVRIRGVVTYYNWDTTDLFIQDSTAGIWVNPGQTRFTLHHGEFVEVEGFSGVGDLAPEINQAHFRSLGEAPMPDPRRPTSDELASGRLDSQWIELEGIVRSVAERDGGLVLNVSSGAFECRVFVLKYPSVPTDIVDRQVRIRGVFAGLYDPSSVQVIGFQVLTPSWSDVKVLERPPQPLWSVPVRPIRLFLRLTPEGGFTHRVHVRGVVTLQQLGQFLCIRDSGGAILVNTTQPTPLKVGDLIDAVGYPAIGDYTVIMRDAIFQRVGAGPAPESVALSPEKLRAGSHNADLVRLSARLLSCTTRPDEEVLELQAGQVTFRAVLNTGTNGSPLDALRAGSLLQLTGVMIVEADKNHQAEGFEILLRSPADVVVLELPSWWTAKRIGWLLTVLAGIVFWVSFWVVALRRRVEECTETIRATLESTVDGILVVNSAGKIVAYNRKFADLWRIPESFLESRDDNAALNFVLSQLKDPDAFLARVRQTYADHDARTDDVIEFKDERVFERHSEPQRLKGKSVGRVWGFRDITERKRAEAALRESETRFRAVFENAAIGIGLVDIHGHLMESNPALQKMLGYSALELVQMAVTEFTHPDDVQASWDLFTELVEGSRDGYHLDKRFCRKDGQVVWGQLTESLVRNQNGEPSYAIGMVEDISERKRAEAALIKEKHLLHTLMDNLPDHIYFKDRESRFTRINKAQAKLFGLSDPAQANGKTDFDFFTNEHAQQAFADEQEITRTGRPVLAKEERETWPDGHATWASTTKMPLCDAQGCIIGTFGISRDITERKRAEEELRESEEKYRTLVSNIPDVVWSMDSRGNLVFVSPNIESLSGFSAEEVYQGGLRFVLETVHPDDLQIMTGVIQAAFQDRQPHEVEYRGRRKDGSWIWVRARSIGAFEKDGVQYLQGLVSDVTQRKQAEAALRESEERFRTAFMTGADAFFIATLKEDTFFEVNDCFRDIFGYAREEVIGETTIRLGFYADPCDRQKMVSEIETNGYVRNLELKGKRKSGESINVLLSANVLPGSGEPIILGVVRDITEQKRAQESLVRLRQAVDASGEVIFMTDQQGVISFVNPEFTRLYGYTEAEVVGKFTPRVLGSGTQPPEDYRDFWKTVLGKRVARGQLANKAKEGRLVTVESSANPIRDEGGNITGYLVIQRDITERKRLEEQFIQAQKMEAVGRLAAGVAHDFNNLLTIINGHSALMLKQLPSNDPARDAFAEIKDAGERASGLTRQLLAFSRQHVRTSSVLDLNILVTDSIKMLRRLIGEDIVLVFNPLPGLGMVCADPGQIEQVLMNMAVNSRDAMPKGGKLTIELSNFRADEAYAASHYPMPPGAYVRLAVTDTGCGMDAETQARIFEPFFTTKGPGKGTGLGLATVYGIIKQNGGYIWVYSEVGLGTTFKIYLPAVEGAPEENEARAAMSGGSETVLLVEDEARLRSMARRILESEGYTVLEAPSGMEALLIASRHRGPIHMLLTDVVMPVMSGRELAERLAKRRTEMKILYMSGYTDDTIVRHGVLESGVAFLQKPFSPEVLARKVREVLDA